MPRAIVGLGTWLNTATVLVGSLIGLWVGDKLPVNYKEIVIAGMALVTLGIGMKLFFGSKNIPIVALALALGGILGTLTNIQGGIEAFGEWAKATLGAKDSSTFVDGVVTASVLFCVGPMTLLGCLQEALERKIDLIAIKSTLDGFGALFLTVSLGPGVLVSAFVVFVVQGLLTILGGRMQNFAKNELLVTEMSAAGGPMLLAIGLKLLDVKDLPVANYLPALVLAPLFVWIMQKRQSREVEATVNSK